MTNNIFQSPYFLGKKEYNGQADSSESVTFFNNLIWGIDEVCSFTSYAKGTIYNLVSRGDSVPNAGKKEKTSIHSE